MPVTAHPEIILLKPSQWADLRTIRLSALKESPSAFTTGLAAEQEITPQTWQHRITSSTWIAARTRQGLIGIAHLLRDRNLLDEYYVESVWVALTHRRRGLLRLMINDLATRARTDGAEELLLWVLDSNDAARDAYLKVGFELTGKRQPIYDHPAGSWECQMRLELSWDHID